MNKEMTGWQWHQLGWTICKAFAPRSRQITISAPYHSTFYRPDALPDAQPTVWKHWRRYLLILYKNTQAHLFQFGLRNSADAVCAKVSILFLNTSQAANIFIARFLPLCYQVFIRNVLTQAVFIQLYEQHKRRPMYKTVHQFQFTCYYIFNLVIWSKFPSIRAPYFVCLTR